MKRTIAEGNKIHFTSLGCARNLVDTEVMLGIVLKAGYEITNQEKKADYLVINTCGFLESARQEALEIIGEIFEKKKEEAKVIVTGCMVPKHKTLLKQMFPLIHSFLGPGDVEKILKAITLQQDETNQTSKSYLQWGEVPRRISTPKHYAYLKIAEGCAKRCSFCIIPTIKGPLKSKTEEQVLREFQALLNQGVHEIILIAQDLGDFGKEQKRKGALEALLKEILKIPRDFWVRLLYLYPDEITDELIEIIQSDSRILPYLDMPIQHIDPKILKLMRRKTTEEHIRNTYEKLRKQIPDIVIRTSLMVGFPGETNEQFEKLVQFVQDYPFDNIGVFSFSKEKEAHAAKLPSHLPEEVKQERYDKLMQVQKSVISQFNQKYIGKILNVMVEGYHPESEFLMLGRFYGQSPEIDGQVILNDHIAVESFGKIYQVEITDVMEYDLIGRAIQPLTSKQNPLLLFVQ